MKSSSLVVVVLFAATILPVRHAAPFSQRYAFCNSTAYANHIYNIGPDPYISITSRQNYRFDLQTKTVSEPFSLKQLLNGENKFTWIDTVINLNGFCQKTALCGGEQWPDVERLHLIIGQRKGSSYGFYVYDLEPSMRRLTQLVPEKADPELIKKLNRLGISMQLEESSAMSEGFWPRISGSPYYQSGLFVPHRGEIFFTVYDNNEPNTSQRTLRRRLGQMTSWEKVVGEHSLFKGMFNLGNRAFGMDKDNKIYEFVWTTDGGITFKPQDNLRELFGCYHNSTIIKELNATGHLKEIPEADPKDNAVVEHTTKASTTTTSTTTSTTTTTAAPVTTSDKPQPEEDKEFEIVPASPSPTERASAHPHNTSAKIRVHPPPEDEHDPNDIDQQRDDPNSSHYPQNKLAEALPFHTQDDGLIWTFSILVGVLILLSIIILIPILIIRHKTRSDRMYINKTNKAKLNTSNCSEEVQLMNSFQLEK